MTDRAHPDMSHPEGKGVWTLLQDHVDHAMWQQDETDASGQVVSRFWIVNPPERLLYDTFDEAESVFERLGEGESDTWTPDGDA